MGDISRNNGGDNFVIYWPELCGSSDRLGKFWDDSLTINTASPDLTACFQETVLVWVPCAVLWLCAPFYLYHLMRQKNVHSRCKFSCMNYLKLIISVLLVACVCCDLIIAFSEGSSIAVSRWQGDIVYILTLLLCIGLIRLEFRKGVHSSGVLFCFWTLLVITAVIPFYSEVIRAKSGTFQWTYFTKRFAVTCTFGILSVLQFSIHLFSDNGALEKHGYESKPISDERKPLLKHDYVAEKDGQHFKKPNPSPENWASCLSYLTWVWTTPLLLIGYKKQLTADKLWDLNESEQTKPVISSFYTDWIGSARSDNESHFEDSSHVIIHDVGKPDDLPDYESISSKKKLKRSSRKSKHNPLQATWKTNSSLYWALIKSFGPYYMLIGIWEIFNIILTFIRPLIQDSLIGYVDSTTSFPWQGYVYAAALFVVTVIRAVVNQQHFQGKMISGMRIRSSLTGAVYRKALLLANSARKDYSVGEIVNLMAVDAQRVGDSTFYMHNLWSAPVNVIVAMVLLWQYLGPASLAGLAILLAMVFGNMALAKIIKKLQVQTMRFKDKRTRFTNEILNGIKVLKLYAWEEAFQEKLHEVRNEELSFIRKSALYFSGTVISITCSPVLFAVVAFAIYIATSGTDVLSAQVAFVSLSLLGSLSRPLTFLPTGIANFVQAMVSVTRLEEYLNNDEIDPSSIGQRCSDSSALELKNASFTWDGPATPNVLKNINLKLKPGSFTCVVGQVGSGKSSLLSSILGELYKSSGEVNRSGSIAYVPQEAWIRNQTVEKNIIFGQPMRRSMYDSSLDACALRPDLNILSAGDQTEIGEKGINLSGGQKQRVSLARAVYSDRDIYLLDDPLSAVDSHVGKHIFDQVIGPEGILGQKTRVLVTHGITYLPKADQIAVIVDGQISEFGSYKELLENNGDFAEFIQTYLNEFESKTDDEASDEDLDEEDKALMRQLKTQLSANPPLERSRSRSDSRRESTSSLTMSGGHSRKHSEAATHRKSQSDRGGLIKRKGSKPGGDEKGPGRPGGPGPGGRGGFGGPPGGRRLIDAEATESGGIKWGIVVEYMRSIGWGYCILVFLSNVLQIGTDLGSNIWLSLWSEDSALEAANLSFMDPSIRVGVYAGLGGATTVAVGVQTVSMAIACTVASQILHENLLTRIMRAPMSFFDTTPIGRILNRFSQDMNTADVSIRMTTVAFFRGISSLLTTIIAISYSTPIFLVILVPLAIGYYFIQRFYIMTSNQLRRIQNVRTSPMYSHFGETVAGASSVRAYQRQADFTEDSDRKLDDMQMARYGSICINRWLSLWLEVLGGLVVLFAAIFAILGKGTVTGGMVGLSISYSLQVTDRLSFFLRNMSDLENNVVSLERIKEYSNVEQEAPWRIDETSPPRDWPHEGQIRISEYSTRYRPGLDLVLKKIFCNIKGKEKVGIVGRTGAGKSSITLALFRIIESVQGHVIIDDVDCSRIGLHELRSKLTIIPQDPTLFSGTLRFNLDPVDAHSDADLWGALKQAHLHDYIASLPSGLDHDVQEGGSNISVGQRQLVCLARALLRKTKILVLDEATAAIDLETDDLIQNTIRTEFEGCTVITIAHRLNTVLDYDRIMVLDAGEVKEFDTPTNLLENAQSMFHAMCADAGIVASGDKKDD